jgi:hypothetical protein
MLAFDDGRRCASGILKDDEIKPDARERLVEARLVDLRRLRNALDLRDQLVTGAECKIVVQVLVTVDVDLGRELAVAGGGDEEVYVRRAVAMTAHRLQQLLGLAAAWTGVTARHGLARQHNGQLLAFRSDAGGL